MFVEYVFIKRKKGFFNLNLYNVNISKNEIIYAKWKCICSKIKIFSKEQSKNSQEFINIK